MANESRGRIINFLLKNYVGVTFIYAILMLILPLPKFFVDLAMVIYLAMAIVILLVVIYTPRASSFSSFPRIILFVNMFGIGINVASTKLILTADGTNPQALARTQSNMVQAFANIVTGGNNIVIGFIIFVIFIIVQMLVINKGAGRVSEVAARFTLDSMSTKSFDIDNQLNNGYITEEEAKEMKAELRRDIDFYANMDGSSKFVSGSAKLGIVITLINLIGGFIIGMVMHGLSFQDSMSVYANLTIGDGLLSQLPSLMLSFATAILVTGDKSDEDLGEKIVREFSRDGNIYMITGAAFVIIGLFLKGTRLLLIPAGSGLLWFGFYLSRKKEKEKVKQAEKAAAAAKGQSNGEGSSPEKDSVAPLDPLSLELGFALIPLVDKDKGAELLERITRIRREAALDLGLSVPSIRIMDNMNLEPNQYSFKIRGIEAGRSSIRPGYFMCMNTGSVTEEIKGESTLDPAFGMPAIWVPEEQRTDAEQAGYVVVDPPTVIATHLTEIIRAHAAEILGRQEVATIIESVKKTDPIVVQEVLEGANRKFTYGEIEKVLQGLLSEQVSIRNMVTILETLANYGNIISNTWDLIEKVREALGLQICMQYADADKKLRVVNLGQDWSQKILEYRQTPTDGSRPYVAFDPVDQRRWISDVSSVIKSVNNMGFMPIIMCPSVIRGLVKASIEREMPGVVVISEKEILAAKTAVQLEVLGEISMQDGN